MTDSPAEAVGLDLDEGRPGTFRLRGEVFEIRHVSPKAYAGALRALDEKEKIDGATLEQLWDAQLDFIEHSVEPEPKNGHATLERFKELRALDYDGIESRDIRPTMRFVMEVHTGRPTESASASGSGPGSSAASSKDEPGSAGVVRPR